MRLAAAVAVAAASVALTACGGPRTGASVREVERVFLQKGLPFASEVTPNLHPNPYLRPRQRQSFFLAQAAKERRLERHLRALLEGSDPNTFSTWLVYVFDSSASADLAQQLVPALKARREQRVNGKGTTTKSGCVMSRGNVIAEADYDTCQRVRAILAALP